MPEGNPLVAQSKKDGDGPGPFTEGNGDYGYATGINIAESATDAFKGIADGDWVSGGLGVASLAGEIAGAAIDPFGYLMSSVASFLMEHVQPLKDMLDSVAGNPPVIQSYADTWGNVAKSLQERQKDLENAVKTGTAEWKGDGADAYRKSAAEAAEAIGGAATVASAIGTVTMIMGQVVAFVRGLVRQLIADLVGKLISWVMEEVFSLGFGTPLVVAQAVTAISKWGEKISELLTKLCETMRRVSPLLGKLAEVFTKIIKVLGKLAGKVTGLDVISTKNIKAGGFFHRGGSGGGTGGSGGGHHSGSGEGDADPGSPSGSRRSDGSGDPDSSDGPNSSHNDSDGSDAPGDRSGESSSRNGSDSPSSDSPTSTGGSHSSPDGTGPSTIDTATSSSRRVTDSPGGSHPDSSPSSFAGDASPTSRGGGSPSDSSYSPQSSPHSDAPSSVSAPHSGGSAPSGGGSHSGGGEPSPHRSSSSNDSTSASGYAPPRADAPSPQAAPPQHIRSNDGGGSPNQSPAGGGIPQHGGGGGTPTNAPAGGGSPSPRPSGGGWTGTPGSRAPEVPSSRVPDGGPSGRRPSGGPSPADSGGPSRTPDRSGPPPQRPSDGGATPHRPADGGSTPQRPSDGGSTPQRPSDGGSTPQRPADGGSASQRPDGGGGSSPQRPADSSSGGPQRPGDGGDTGQPKRPGADPGLGRSEPAPASGGSHAPANRGSGDGSAPPAAAAVATGPGGAQRGGPDAGGGARRPDGSPEPVARGGARTDAPPAKPGDAPQRTGKETPAQNGKPNVDESGKPKDGDKPGRHENTEPDKKPSQHDDAERKPGNDKSDHNPEHRDPNQHDSDGPNHHDDPAHDGTPPHHDEPLSPDEVNHRHAEDTPAGSSYHRDDPELGDLPHRVQPDPDGRYTVDVHVTADGHARIGDRLYTPEEFADILRRNGNYDGGPIRLIGCDAASNDFAHRLSRDLDTEVMAPNKPAWTDSNGRVFSSDYEIGPDGRMRPRIPPDGEWSVHRPDGTSHHVGDDGFAPDGKHHDPHDVDADSSRHRGEDGDDDVDWRDRPGPDGRTPRENLADPEYIKKHYYEWTDQKTGRTELRIRHSAVDPQNPPHPVDLVDGKPVFKHDRPAAEFMGYDDARSATHAPQRAPEHDAGGGQHQGDGSGQHAGEHDSGNSQHDQNAGEQHVPGTHSDTSNWREKDYDAIDEKVRDRETKYHELNDTPNDSPEWKDAHNAKNDASEKLGEEASGHAVRDRLHREFTEAHPDQNFDVREHPDAPEGSHRYQIVDGDGNVRADITPRHPIDGEKPGAGNFDHIWEVDYHNGGEPHYIVHEAKGPGGQPSTRYVPEDMRTYRQGHPKYFDDIVKKMAHTDPDLADALERAKLQKRLDYVEVRALVDQTEHTHKNLGYAYKPFNGYDYKSPLTPASGEE